jgi:Tfp pilus tip-associated adhesin PilY1
VIFTAKPIYSLNYAVINTLIPRGSDPCSPTFRGASIVVDAASGGAPVILQTNDETGATRPPIVVQPPLPCDGDKCRDPTPRIVNGEFKLPTTAATFTVPTPPPHRGSWRELLEIL